MSKRCQCSKYELLDNVASIEDPLGLTHSDRVCESRDWKVDAYLSWNLYKGGVHVWLEPRPHYCDRGHYIGKVDGIESLDDADGFPRYYMNLERAKAEMSEWLDWRLKLEKERE